MLVTPWFGGSPWPAVRTCDGTATKTEHAKGSKGEKADRIQRALGDASHALAERPGKPATASTPTSPPSLPPFHQSSPREPGCGPCHCPGQEAGPPQLLCPISHSGKNHAGCRALRVFSCPSAFGKLNRYSWKSLRKQPNLKQFSCF